MNKIAIIIPYFGKWPEWIELYFYSCAQNPEIDWQFFTNCDIPVNYNSNLHFYNYSFSDYCELVSEKLNIDFNPENPYKLCGLKPFYGFIHQEILSEYEFWGFGDVDIVWGNIKSFYTDNLLTKFDVFSTHADRISGHLAIIRNTNKYRELCFKIEEWQSKLLSPESIPLDEVEFSQLLYPESKYIIKLYAKFIRKLFNWRDAWVIYYNLVPFFNFLFFTKQRKLYLKEQHTTPILYPDGLTCKHDTDVWYYKNAVITNKKSNVEYIYLHFMIYKKNGFRNDHFWRDGSYLISDNYNFENGVLINKEGIFESKN